MLKIEFLCTCFVKFEPFLRVLNNNLKKFKIYQKNFLFSCKNMLLLARVVLGGRRAVCAAVPRFWAYSAIAGGGRDVLITVLAAYMLLLTLYSLFLCCLGIYRRRAIHAPVPRFWAYSAIAGGGRDVLITALAAYMLLLALYSLFLCCLEYIDGGHFMPLCRDFGRIPR